MLIESYLAYIKFSINDYISEVITLDKFIFDIRIFLNQNKEEDNYPEISEILNNINNNYKRLQNQLITMSQFNDILKEFGLK